MPWFMASYGDAKNHDISSHDNDFIEIADPHFPLERLQIQAAPDCPEMIESANIFSIFHTKIQQVSNNQFKYTLFFSSHCRLGNRLAERGVVP